MGLVQTLLEAFLCLGTVTITQSQYTVLQFKDNNNHGAFNHLALNKINGKLYLAAVNRLYQLDSNLGVDYSIETGPRVDDDKCISSNLTCTGKPEDNYNKLLLVDYENRRLIVCTNLFHGVCSKHILSDIRQTDPSIILPVVANDATSSTVGYIARGAVIKPNNPKKNALYISASWTDVGIDGYKERIPAFGVRNLTTFKIYYENIGVWSKKLIEAQQRKTFRVHYVYGFPSNGFSYMLSVQKEDVGSRRYVSKIFRVCQDDERFYSYTELKLQCTHLTGDFNLLQAAVVAKPGSELANYLGINVSDDVLFAVFSLGRDFSRIATGSSVMCIYSLKYIQKVFRENIENCFKGNGNTGPKHFTSGKRCTQSSFKLNDPYCGEHDINTPIAGTTPIAGEAFMGFKGMTPLASIAVTTTFTKYTVAFVGLKNGHLRKVSIKTNKNTFEYADIPVEEGSAINSDMFFDTTKEYLYVMTERKISKMRVQYCEQYKTCLTCLGAKDPYCGWCSLENRCTTHVNCPNGNVKLRWLPYDSNKCTTLVKVEPDQVQLKANTRIKLKLTIQSLPDSSDNSYMCAFNHGSFTFSDLTTKISNTMITCYTPPFDKIPPFPNNQDHIVLKLALTMNNKEFVFRNFTIYDCAVHQSCTKCTESKFNCTWCIRAHKCTDDMQTCDDKDIIQRQQLTTTSPNVQHTCPMFNHSDALIAVVAGKERSIVVTGYYLKQYQQDSLKCYFDLHMGKEVSAMMIGRERIRCDPVLFDYAGEDPFRLVPFQLRWGNGYPVDNPGSLQIKIYKCSSMAGSCGQCLTIDQAYDCGWCLTERRCTIQSYCSQKWLNKSANCPNPRITSVHPVKGPKLGGTNITITGENLGKSVTDVVNRVFVATIKCHVYRELYITARQIVCRTDATNVTLSGQVIIKVAGQYNAVSSDHFFQFVSPKVISISPSQGPQGGGTRITVHGQHLDAGSSHRVLFGSYPCYVDMPSLTALSLDCETTGSQRVESVPLTLRIDNMQTIFPVHYHYRKNPTFYIIDKDSRISTVSGGFVNVYRGFNLNITEQSRMIFWHKETAYTSNCQKVNSSRLICPTPRLYVALSGTRHFPIEVSFGFEMDNVLSVRNITAEQGTFEIWPDPRVEKFKDDLLLHKPEETKILELKGRYLYPIRNYFEVNIGMEKCTDVRVPTSGDRILCTAPSKQPKSQRHENFPVVRVTAGNTSIIVGRIEYQTPPFLSSVATIAIIVCVSLAVIILVVTIAFFVLCHVKSREKDTIMKKYQGQIDQLSMKVAKECKEGFAELQMSITTELSEVSGVKVIPYRNYHAFAMNVLFANDANHPVMKRLEVDRNRLNNVESGLQQLFQLCNNKTFLLIFLRTLEANQNFGMRDRVNVASLVCLAYHSRLAYITDILKTLLAELIERCMESKENPKILLRRNESIAEKMLGNWFTFLLYKFLKDVVGEPLYMLYLAIKQQVAKGPIDAVSGEARYALSEDKLIRQQIDFKPMTLNVVDVETQYGQQVYHSVKVLDCDSITQVKEKILDLLYKNTTSSGRPTPEELDLEWNQGTLGRKLILQDEDSTSKIEGDYKRINTLSHYKVPDQALVALVTKQPSLYNLSLISEKSARFNGEHLPLYKSPSMGKPAMCNNNAIYSEVENRNFYHLIKPHDNDGRRGDGDRASKMVAEIYLTRLLKTKGTLQRFVDDLIERIFSTAHGTHALPLAIKYLFDFLDEQALEHSIQDPEVVHSWKSNSLPLRFWVNVIKNPNFVFDIHKSNIVDSCLSVVAQTFMDSCSMAESRLGINSPSSKLLYAQEIPRYKRWVERYYQDIRSMPSISDQDMNAMLSEESHTHCQDFNTTAALHELYKYILQYNTNIMEALETDEFAKKYRLTEKLENVHKNMANNLQYC